MYRKVPTDLNFVKREEEVEKFWDDNRIFEKSVEEREGCPTYMFYDGPPTANGKPHIGHVETRVIKDMIPRYHAMKGEQVPRKAGWDTHGLPVELDDVQPRLAHDGEDLLDTLTDEHPDAADARPDRPAERRRVRRRDGARRRRLEDEDERGSCRDRREGPNRQGYASASR